jgi:hypothetical protein
MIMDKFETQFEDLDVQTSYMETSMGQTTAMTTPVRESTHHSPSFFFIIRFGFVFIFRETK